MTTVVRLLREHTLLTHRRVEAQLDLLDAGLTPNRLFGVIERFCGFWLAGEPGIDEWARAHQAEAVALHWARRRRAHLFAADLAVAGFAARPGLGITQKGRAIPCPPPVFDRFEHAQVLGWLYVTEGSTLGGAIIDRHLRGLTSLGGFAPRCFIPYHEGPGPMWQSFRTLLQAFAAGDRARTEAVIDAAVATFDSLEGWLVPLAQGSPV
jgi:heme oxygenase